MRKSLTLLTLGLGCILSENSMACSTPPTACSTTPTDENPQRIAVNLHNVHITTDGTTDDPKEVYSSNIRCVFMGTYYRSNFPFPKDILIPPTDTKAQTINIEKATEWFKNKFHIENPGATIISIDITPTYNFLCETILRFPDQRSTRDPHVLDIEKIDLRVVYDTKFSWPKQHPGPSRSRY